MFRFVPLNEIRGTKRNEAIDIRPQRKGPCEWVERGWMEVAENGQNPNYTSIIFGQRMGYPRKSGWVI